MTPAAPAPQGAIGRALEAWRTAWTGRDVPAYLKMYSPSFKPAGDETLAAWQARRRSVLGRASDVAVDISDVVTTLEGGADRATTVFNQNYRSASYQDRTRKTLRWERVDGTWLIVSETAAPLK